MEPKPEVRRGKKIRHLAIDFRVLDVNGSGLYIRILTFRVLSSTSGKVVIAKGIPLFSMATSDTPVVSYA